MLSVAKQELSIKKIWLSSQTERVWTGVTGVLEDKHTGVDIFVRITVPEEERIQCLRMVLIHQGTPMYGLRYRHCWHLARRHRSYTGMYSKEHGNSPIWQTTMGIAYDYNTSTEDSNRLSRTKVLNGMVRATNLIRVT